MLSSFVCLRFGRRAFGLTHSLTSSSSSRRPASHQIGSAILFNLLNGAFIASELRAVGGTRRSQESPLFTLGLLFAITGAFINVFSDEVLLLRRRATSRSAPPRVATRSSLPKEEANTFSRVDFSSTTSYVQTISANSSNGSV